MYKKGLLETSDDNSDNTKASNLRVIEYEKVNTINKENELITYDKRIFTEYLHKIQNCEEKLKIFQILGYIFIIIFFVLLVIKFSVKNEKELKYFYLLIPTILATLLFSLSFNYFLKLKQLIEKEEEDILAGNLNADCSMGNFLSYLCLNFICLAICIFFILISCKLENQIPFVGLSMVNIPLYISLGIIFFYFIFILPAFILNRYFWGIILISSYLINATIFLILFSMKIDHQTNLTFTKIFIPVLIALIVQLIYSLYQLFAGENSLVMKVLDFCSISFFLGSVIYLTVILDLNDNTQKHKISILFLTSAVLFSIEKITNLFITNDDNYNNNHEKE